MQQSRNARIQPGQPGNIDASTGIKVEDVPNIPTDQLRALGDIHPLGNPHYWIPPKNARGIAKILAQRFAQLDAARASTYQAGLAAFEHRLDAKEKEWDKAAAPLHGLHVVTYHKSWSYVAEWLGMQQVGYIEPKPGIPPAANHTAQLIELMRKSNVKLVIVESFYSSNLARSSPRTATPAWPAPPWTSARPRPSRPTLIWSRPSSRRSSAPSKFESRGESKAAAYALLQRRFIDPRPAACPGCGPAWPPTPWG